MLLDLTMISKKNAVISNPIITMQVNILSWLTFNRSRVIMMVTQMQKLVHLYHHVIQNQLLAQDLQALGNISTVDNIP